MWATFKINVLAKMASGEFGRDIDSFAEFYADEYDKAIKSGGDIVNSVSVINGNKVAFAEALKVALKKGQQSGGNNVNPLQNIYPCFSEYWNGAEMAPLPNPLKKPLGWSQCPPPPGAIKILGPNPATLAAAAAKNEAEVKVMEAAMDELKKQNIEIPLPPPLPAITINVYDTVKKILNEENKPEEEVQVDDNVKNNPTVQLGLVTAKKLKQAKKKKPSIGSQEKPSEKVEFPELVDRKKIIEDTTNQLKEVAKEEIKKQMIEPIKEAILTPIYQTIAAFVAVLDSIPSPKPTKEQIKKFVKDKSDGNTPDVELPGVDVDIPNKDDLQKQIEEKLPSDIELDIMALDVIKGKIPEIPFQSIVPPNYMWSTKTNVMIDPFINMANLHLLGCGGKMMVTAQYPVPSPPMPTPLSWKGYKVTMGPPIPDLPMTVEMPTVPELPPLPELPELPSLPVLPNPELPNPAALLAGIGAGILDSVNPLGKIG